MLWLDTDNVSTKLNASKQAEHNFMCSIFFIGYGPGLAHEKLLVKRTRITTSYVMGSKSFNPVQSLINGIIEGGHQSYKNYEDN